MPPDISILIPAFNSQETLAAAVSSALAQTGVDLEVVIVDDCSSDGTVPLARSFRDPRVKVVALSSNRGPGGARNAGLEVITGEYVSMLDADDTIRPERSAVLIERLRQSGADCVVDDVEVVRRGGAPAEPMFGTGVLSGFPEMSLADFVMGNRLFEGAFNFGYLKPTIRTAFLRERGIRYDEALRIGEDYLLLATLLARGGRCAVEPSVGYSYQVREGSISRVLELRHVRAMRRADEAFVSGHRLDEPASAAFRARARTLRQAETFLQVIDALKGRSPVRALGHAISNPSALRHLRMPVEARLKRLQDRFRQRTPA